VHQLKKTLTLKDVISLTIGSIVGSGLLALPGLAYATAGADALLAWIFMVILVIPLVIIFGDLSVRYPSAGGIVGFTAIAFGPGWARSMAFLMAGTFPVGIPALAIIGANYLAYALGLGRTATLVTAFLILALVTAVHLRGSKTGSGFQNLTALLLTLILVAISVVVLPKSIAQAASLEFSYRPALVWSSMGLLFWAFTGWENMSFTSEEFVNPRRDFPLGLGLSFILISILYLVLSFNVVALLERNHPMTVQAPIAEIVRVAIGPTAGTVVAALSLLIILVNASAWVWGGSRLIFGGAREGYLPSYFNHLHPGSGAPDRSLLFMLLAYGLVIILVWALHIDLVLLIMLVNVNLLIGYLASIAAFIKINHKNPVRVILGLFSFLLCLVFMAVFSYVIIYALVLMLLPVVLDLLQQKRRSLRGEIRRAK